MRTTRRRLNVRLLLSILGGMLLLVVGVHFLHDFQVKRNIKTLLGQADKAEKQGDLVKAEEHLSRYLLYQPRDVDALIRYGRLLEREAKTPEQRYQVIQVYEKVLRRDPGRREIRRRLVELALDPRLGQTSEAQSHLEILLGKAADDAEKGDLTFLLGRTKEIAGKPDEALALYEQARKLVPGRVECYVRIADLLRSGSGGRTARDQADRVMDAREVKDGVIAANGRSEAAYLARAAYRRKYGVPGAEDDVARMLELAPDSPEVLVAAADYALEKKDVERALAHLRHGTERNPANVTLYRNLASLESRLERTDDAVKDQKRAIELMPDDLGLRWSLAEMLLQSARLDDAEKVIADLKEKGARAELHGFLAARVLLQRGRWSAAAEELEKQLPALAGLTGGKELTKRALIMLGQCREKLGNPDACHDAYRRAVSIDLDPDPYWAAARFGLASSLALQNKIEAALDEYRLLERSGRAPGAGVPLARLLVLQNRRLPVPERRWGEVEQVLAGLEKLTPDAPDVAILRADSLASQDQPDRARELLEKARDKQPDQVKLWAALAGLAASAGKYDDGLAVLDKAEARLGDRVDLRLARANILARRGGGAPDAALESLERGPEKFDPGDQERLWRGLALVYAGAGAAGPADRLLGRLAERDPNDLSVRLAQFDRAIQTGDDKAADLALSRVHEVEGRDGFYWPYAKALRLIRKVRKAPGDRAPLAEARALLTEVAARRPSWSRAALALADVDDLDGKPDAAIKNYLRAVVELGDRSPAAIRRVVRLLYERQQFAQAALVFQKLRADRTPVSSDLERLDADISMRNQDFGRALEIAEKTTSEASEDYHELLWLGQVRAASGQPAEPVLRRAAERAKGDPIPWLALVTYLAGTDQKTQAAAAAKEAESKISGERAPLVLAQCYEAAGDGERAGKLYDAALKASPDDATTLRGVASHYLRLGRIDEAKTILRRGIAAKGAGADAAWATRTLAMVTASGGGYRGALEALEILGVSGKESAAGKDQSPATLRAEAKVLAVQPNRASRRSAIEILEGVTRRDTPESDDLYLLAQLYEADGEWPKARLTLLKLLEKRNAESIYYYAFVRGLIRHNDLDTAQLYLGKLEQAAPRQPYTVEARARLLAARKQGDEVAALLKEFARGAPARAVPVARLLEELGQVGAAEAVFREIAAKPARPTDVLQLAGFLSRRGKVGDALDVCDRAWQTCPAETVANSSVLILYNATGDVAQFRRVEQRLEEATRKDPGKVSLRFDMANLRSLQGRYADAEAIFRELHEKNPSFAAPLNNLAWMLALKDGARSKAVALINRAIELDGETPELLDTRAVVSMAGGQAEPAIRDLENAIAVKASPDMYFHLARAYNMAQRRGEATDAFKKAKELGLTLDHLHPLERDAFRDLNDGPVRR